MNKEECSVKKNGFKYYASNGLARVEEEFIGIDFKDIKYPSQVGWVYVNY